MVSSRNIGLLHFNGHESLSLSQHRLESSGSDTEDETWRIRIEKGEFSEKVSCKYMTYFTNCNKILLS